MTKTAFVKMAHLQKIKFVRNSVTGRIVPARRQKQRIFSNYYIQHFKLPTLWKKDYRSF